MQRKQPMPDYAILQEAAALEATLPVKVRRLHDCWVTVEPLAQNK